MSTEIFQTTASDIRAGWRYFRSWKQRFWWSICRGRGLEPKEYRDLIYLVDHDQIRHLEHSDDIEFRRDVEDARDQKIAFMEAYLSVAALESKNFEAQTRCLLKMQARLCAPKVFGFWFWQSDIAKFGAGASPLFQGEDMSIFCEHVNQIDFSDISTILPYDGIIVRHPTKKWNEKTSKKLADHIAYDLSFDGAETDVTFTYSDVTFTYSNELLELEILSPDFGIKKR